MYIRLLFVVLFAQFIYAGADKSLQESKLIINTYKHIDKTKNSQLNVTNTISKKNFKYKYNKKQKPKTKANDLKKFDYSKNNITIVVDPGHGGEDPGAVGMGGAKEKDITLSISKQVKYILTKNMPGIRIFLTRNKDITISLPARTDFANQMQATVFVSLHVNSSLNRDIYGIETYYLNISHDKYSLRLAARENAMTEEETSNLEFILADLSMKSSVYDSFNFGRIMQYSLCGNLAEQWDNVRNLGIKNAMFYVLMGAKMPAVLIEASFVSSNIEEQRLESCDYQYAAAEGIANGIQRFVEEKIFSDQFDTNKLRNKWS